MAVLDLGCGTGSITAGIAEAVGPTGEVLGIDRDSKLLAMARQEHGGIANLSFEQGDATALPFEQRFDIVTAARTVQWISQPERAIASMIRAVRPGGQIVVLDYNHDNNSWEPEPPREYRRFYESFLAWRKANQWDNRIADRLPGLFEAAGIGNVEVQVDDETVLLGEADFQDGAAIWTHVMRVIGPEITATGFLSEHELMDAEIAHRAWVRNGLRRQTLEMRTVSGEVRRPGFAN
jgi:SAM-dependent methyltransferase